MLDLIWLFGGVCGGRGAAGSTGLDAGGWLWELVGMDPEGILEAREEPELRDSFTPDCGCFLGMVKVLLPTLRAPVGCSRDDPGGPEEEKTGMGGGGGGPVFFNLTTWDRDCFFKSFALLEDVVLVLPLDDETGAGLAIFRPGDLLPPLGDIVAAGGGFFSIGAGSFFSGSVSSVFSSSSF